MNTVDKLVYATYLRMLGQKANLSPKATDNLISIYLDDQGDEPNGCV